VCDIDCEWYPRWSWLRNTDVEGEGDILWISAQRPWDDCGRSSYSLLGKRVKSSKVRARCHNQFVIYLVLVRLFIFVALAVLSSSRTLKWVMGDSVVDDSNSIGALMPVSDSPWLIMHGISQAGAAHDIKSTVAAINLSWDALIEYNRRYSFKWFANYTIFLMTLGSCYEWRSSGSP